MHVRRQGWFDMCKKVETEVNPTGSDCHILYRVRMDSSDRRFRFHDREGLTGDGHMRDRWWRLATGTAKSAHWKRRCHCCNDDHSGVHMEVTPSYLNGKRDTTLEETV